MVEQPVIPKERQRLRNLVSPGQWRLAMLAITIDETDSTDVADF